MNLKNVELSIKINNNQYKLNVENNKLAPPVGIKKKKIGIIFHLMNYMVG